MFLLVGSRGQLTHAAIRDICIVESVLPFIQAARNAGTMMD